jgi:hypothetical protein
VFYKLKDAIRRTHFAWECREVLRSRPVALGRSSGLALLSQLQHKDVVMYLLAVKSFARQSKPGAVFVLNDGSLDASDVDVICAHIPGVTLLELPSFRSAACPRGGCWERLLAVCSLVKDYYVIQLDSDTLTVGAIDEVRNCIQQGTAFALGTWDGQQFETMAERQETAARLETRQPNAHVQLVAEANFDKLHDFRSLRYVRGCAGFAGFGRRSFTREFVENISVQMRAAMGDKWAEWGSEQVMSNIVVANAPSAAVLPHPKYADCTKMRAGQTTFIHFIGGCRFAGGVYARLGREVIRKLDWAVNDNNISPMA